MSTTPWERRSAASRPQKEARWPPRRYRRDDLDRPCRRVSRRPGTGGRGPSGAAQPCPNRHRTRSAPQWYSARRVQPYSDPEHSGVTGVAALPESMSRVDPCDRATDTGGWAGGPVGPRRRGWCTPRCPRPGSRCARRGGPVLPVDSGENCCIPVDVTGTVSGDLVSGRRRWSASRRSGRGWSGPTPHRGARYDSRGGSGGLGCGSAGPRREGFGPAGPRRSGQRPPCIGSRGREARWSIADGAAA